MESPTRLEVSCNQGLLNPLATAEHNSSTSYQTLHSRPTSSDSSESNSVVLDVDSSHQNDVGGRNSSSRDMINLQTTIETGYAQSAKGIVATNELLMPPPSPGQLGFVRSSEVRPVTRLEVRYCSRKSFFQCVLSKDGERKRDGTATSNGKRTALML